VQGFFAFASEPGFNVANGIVIGQLSHHTRVVWLADIDNGQEGRGALVRNIQDPPSILSLLQGHSLSAIAPAIEVVLGDQAHVLTFGVNHKLL
jgi:hypothetical protein